MSYYMIKADKNHNIYIDDNPVVCLRSMVNNFFIVENFPTGLKNYFVEIPDEIYKNLIFFDFPSGKKFKIGWDPFNGCVQYEPVENTNGTPSNAMKSKYTDEQESMRFKVRMWFAKEFILDAKRLGIYTDEMYNNFDLELNNISNNVVLDEFYSKHLMYDC